MLYKGKDMGFLGGKFKATALLLGAMFASMSAFSGGGGDTMSLPPEWRERPTSGNRQGSRTRNGETARQRGNRRKATRGFR